MEMKKIATVTSLSWKNGDPGNVVRESYLWVRNGKYMFSTNIGARAMTILERGEAEALFHINLPKEVANG